MSRDVRPATMADLLEIVTRSPQSIVVSQLSDTTIVAASAAAGELFEQRADALVGRRASSLFHGADAVYGMIAKSALAAGAVDSYCARRRLSSRAGAEAWFCVRVLEVEAQLIAVWMAVPVGEPRPLDGVEQELTAALGVSWVSPLPALGCVCAEDFADPQRRVGASAYTALDRLTHRQHEIVAALLQGERVPAIASTMFLSASTVRSHLSAIFKAFEVHSQTELLSLLRPYELKAHGPRRK